MRIILPVIALLYMIGITSCVSDQDQKTFRDHPVIISDSIPYYFNSMFRPEIKGKLKLKESFQKKGKDTVSNFLYDGKYYIQAYKLSNNYNLSLKESIKEIYNEANRQEPRVFYYSNQRSLLDINDRMLVGKQDVPSKITLSLYGERPTILAKNDTVAYYYLSLANLAVCYGNSKRQEIFVGLNEHMDEETWPIALMFIEKAKKLYLLLISPKRGTDLQPNQLSKLISK